MNTKHVNPAPRNANQDSRRTMLRAVVGAVLYFLLVPALLFIVSGTVDWPMAWLYAALWLASVLDSRLITLRRNPDLLRERASFTRTQGAQSWDRVLVGIVALCGPIAMVVVAGLDQRLGWSSFVPRWGQLLGVLGIAGGYGLGVWAMLVNPYFSAVARIQKDRGQIVVKEGPYRFVRHPAYAGGLLAALAIPFMLDAIWALIPGLVVFVGIIVRTRLEDKMLMGELDGYRAYAASIPHRLIPGIW